MTENTGSPTAMTLLALHPPGRILARFPHWQNGDDNPYLRDP
jgi:hypothetical protein